MEKALHNYTKMSSYDDLIAKYQKTFKQLSGKEINTDLVLKITAFQKYLSKISVMLKNFKEMTKNASKAKIDHSEKLSTCLC